ncbi:EamA-like transporter family protein [Labrenzia sp. THAF82]|uniref:DMT family transporter n=1 Tax=Labrenzia sp. THAF82 TaxID=2587861 RepID=UPI001268EFC7|nr:DMT family transporter [Labrenzia sp. THAF82]QFT33501.1 EamA-like transporter family protein [Labrenzia sp. THAF82]
MLGIVAASTALFASIGWASGIVLAQMPAKALGAFEFTRIQLIFCAALMGVLSSLFDLWPSIDWQHWPAFLVSSLGGILLGNLAMIECLRRGGPRLTELLLCLKAPVVAGLAYFWIGETIGPVDLLGGVLILAGLVIAIRFGSQAEREEGVAGKRLLSVVLLGLLAATLQGAGFLAVKPALTAGAEPVAVTAIRLLGAAAVISLASIWPSQAVRADTETSPYLLFRTIMPGVIGYGISSSLLLYAFANTQAGVAAVLGSLSPLCVLLILWATKGKRPGLEAMAGTAIAVIGTAVIVLY